MEWISVEERLPELHKEVLVSIYMPKNGMRFCMVGAMDHYGKQRNGPPKWGDSGWLSICGASSGWFKTWWQPTHWMPLPDPPKSPQNP